MKHLLEKAYRAGASGSVEGLEFETWYDENVVDFECSDCGERVIRPRKDDVDIPGLTPQRCGTCTLDRMAEAKR